MDNNYMKTILSGVKEWTENLTDDAVDKANNALDKALFVVNITPNGDGTYSADKTFVEIVQAYNEGKYSIVANVNGSILYLTHVSTVVVNFTNLIENEFGFLVINKRNDVFNESGFLATTDSKLPNPHALTFTGAVSETYDGSSAKTIEIPIGVDGQSAYAAAQAGGYTDTEANFYADLAAMQGLASALAAI